MKPGARFSFIVDPDVAGRMDRVVLMCDGRVIGKESDAEGVVFEVEKT